MPAPTLSPGDALADYDITVAQVDLDDAAATILAQTGTSVADHVDVRSIASGNVRRAWAIVAGRIRSQTSGDEARAVISESDGDYSYNEDVALKASGALSLLAGVPNQLLDLASPVFDEYADQCPGARRSRIPDTIDDFGVRFPH